MSYDYQKKSQQELEDIADRILEKVPRRVDGCAVDIEGIIEDFGISIIPRRGQLQQLALGYTPKDPHYIVLAEAESSYPPHYRSIAAEEFCHIVLEYSLYEAEKLPEGSAGHELTVQQRWDIEYDAKYLAGAVLFPKAAFRSRFATEVGNLSRLGADHDKALRAGFVNISKAFRISEYRAARRARDLKLITSDQFMRNYPDRVQL